MKNTKLAKFKCSVTGEAFGLEVASQGGIWQVVNMVKLTPEQDSKIESQVDVGEHPQVADNLLNCDSCGSRVVGGCACPTEQRRRCQKNEPYRYQCIFCQNLKPDNSAAVGVCEGEQIKLEQGQVITLTRRGVRIRKLLVGMGWKPSTTSHNMDLDSTVVMVDSNGRIHETIYFGHKDDAVNSIHHHGDNLVGSEKGINDQDRDDENISIDLDKVPVNVKALAFVVNIYDCTSRSQTLGDVRDIHIRLIESDTKQVLAKFNTFSQNSRCTAMIIGIAYRTGSNWNFKAMGDCNNATDVHRLAEISRSECQKYISQ